MFLACQTFYTQRGCWFMRPIQKPWGVTPGHSQVFSSAWFLAVSHLREGLLFCQPLFTAAKWFAPLKITPFCLFCWPAEERVPMQVWAGAADGHGGLEWMEQTRPGGETRVECWRKQGALNFTTVCNADALNFQLYRLVTTRKRF